MGDFFEILLSPNFWKGVYKTFQDLISNTNIVTYEKHLLSGGCKFKNLCCKKRWETEDITQHIQNEKIPDEGHIQ